MLHLRTAVLPAVLAAAALGLHPSSASASFCSCGYTSKAVRHWNNTALATPAGQRRIDLVTSLEQQLHPAQALWWGRTGAVVKTRSKGIARRTLTWFKEVYRRCPSQTKGCRAMRNCLIAGYTAYLSARAAGYSVPSSLRQATVACISAAFATFAGHALQEGEPDVRPVDSARSRLRAGALRRAARGRPALAAVLAASDMR